MASALHAAGWGFMESTVFLSFVRGLVTTDEDQSGTAVQEGPFFKSLGRNFSSPLPPLLCEHISGFSDKQETEKAMEGRFSFMHMQGLQKLRFLNFSALPSIFNHLGTHLDKGCLFISVSSCFQD